MNSTMCCRRIAETAGSLMSMAAAHGQQIVAVDPPAGSNWISVICHGLSGDGGTMVATASAPNFSEQRGFRWRQSTGWEELAPFPGDAKSAAYGINWDGSYVVGGSWLGNTGRALRWNASGAVQDLGRPPSGFEVGPAQAITPDGSLVAGGGLWMAYRWTAASGMQELDRPALTFPFWTATAISADGSIIAGWADSDPASNPMYIPAPMMPVRWAQGNNWAYQALGSQEGWTSGMSGDGSVIIGTRRSGYWWTSYEYAGYRWTAATGMVFLPLSGAFTGLTPQAISHDGHTIIGQGGAPGGRAFIWTEQLGTRDLNEHLPTLGVNLNGWVLRTASGISADGRIFAGEGTLNGVARLYIVSLGAVACYANCDHSTASPLLNVADFGCFLQRFAGGDLWANCDQSSAPPVLNIADFGCFLQKFAAGCN
jgi:uncharacterized membrane protein